MAAMNTGQPHDDATAPPPRRGIWLRVIALLAIGFGLLTLKEGGATLSGDSAAVTAAGNVVPFVLWFNFVAGFAYVAAGAGLWLRRRWAAWLALAIAATTALAFAALGVHVASGGAYEQRTVAAMTLRLLVWLAIAAFARRRLLHRPG
jgi:hypothetical protein